MNKLGENTWKQTGVVIFKPPVLIFPLLGKNSPQTSQLRNNIDLLGQSFFFLIFFLTQEAWKQFDKVYSLGLKSLDQDVNQAEV